MCPWADASSASLANFSMKFSLSVFTLFLTARFASVYCSYCCCFWCSRSAVVNCTFFSFLNATLLLSTESQSCCWYFFFPRTSLHVLIHISLICCHCVSMPIFPSSRRSCRASYLFLIVSRKVCVSKLVLTKSDLIVCGVIREGKMYCSKRFTFSLLN